MIILLGGLMMAQPGLAEETSWDYRVAHALSTRLSKVETELRSVEEEMPGLPGLPLDDQGGTGGFASLHSQSEPSTDGEHAITLTFAKEVMVDLVGLVPSRRYEL
ncbi:MAG: hypothetical protein ACPG4K_13815, partial [Haloferula sp.]